jgi:hypothetical protein
VSDKEPPADQPEPALADETAPSGETEQSDAKRAAKIADENEKSGAETVV